MLSGIEVRIQSNWVNSSSIFPSPTTSWAFCESHLPYIKKRGLLGYWLIYSVSDFIPHFLINQYFTRWTLFRHKLFIKPAAGRFMIHIQRAWHVWELLTAHSYLNSWIRFRNCRSCCDALHVQHDSINMFAIIFRNVMPCRPATEQFTVTASYSRKARAGSLFLHQRFSRPDLQDSHWGDGNAITWLILRRGAIVSFIVFLWMTIVDWLKHVF